MPLGREVRLLIKDVNRMCIDLANPLHPSRYVIRGSFGHLPVAVVEGPETASLSPSLMSQLNRYTSAVERLEAENSPSLHSALAASGSDEVNSEAGKPTPVLSPPPLPWPPGKAPIYQYQHLSLSTFTVPLSKHRAKEAAPIRPQSAGGVLVSKEWHGPLAYYDSWDYCPELKMPNGKITPPLTQENPIIPPPSEFGSRSSIDQSFKSIPYQSDVFDGYSSDSVDEEDDKLECMLLTPRYFWKFYGIHELADMEALQIVRSYNHPKIDQKQELAMINRYFVGGMWRVTIEKQLLGWCAKDGVKAQAYAEDFARKYGPEPASFNLGFSHKICLDRHAEIFFMHQICRKLYAMYRSMYEHGDAHFDVQKKRDYFNLAHFYRKLAQCLNVHIQFDRTHRHYNLPTLYNHLAKD